MRGISPLDIRDFEYCHWGECLSNAHWLGPWRQQFDDESRLRQNHWKITGKTKKFGFCVACSVTSCTQISLYPNVMLTPSHLLTKWRPEKHELLNFIAAFLDRNFWIKQSMLNA
jgi:hypothetical protein